MEPEADLAGRVTPSWARRFAVAALILAVSAVCTRITVWFITQQGVDANSLAWILSHLAFASVGTVIVRRHPGHRVGWLFVGIGLFGAIGEAATGYTILGYQDGRYGADVAAWLATWIWAPSMGMVVLAFVLFPDGRAVGRGWAVVGWTALGLTFVIALCNAIGLWPLRSTLVAFIGGGEEAVLDHWAEVVLDILFPLVLLAALASMISLIVRFRRAGGIERQQLKWLATSALLTAPALVMGQTLFDEGLGKTLLYVLAVPGWIAVAAGIAILRYRLYDIDRILSRTLAYSIVTIGSIGLYAGGVVALGSLARVVTGESGDLVVAVSTLMVVAAFTPLRRRVQLLVDRRFNRSRVDALRAADRFGRQLRDQVDLGSIVTELRDAATLTVQPRSVSVYTVRCPGTDP